MDKGQVEVLNHVDEFSCFHSMQSVSDQVCRPPRSSKENVFLADNRTNTPVAGIDDVNVWAPALCSG